MIADEWDHTHIHCASNSWQGGQRGKGESDEALSVDEPGKGRRQKGKGKKGGCYECSDPNHWKRDCPKWKQKQEQKKKASKGEEANVADLSDSDVTFTVSEDDATPILPLFKSQSEALATVTNTSKAGVTRITLFDSGVACHISPY
ncbi:hypothetical protein P691DRAFT_769349 [Macrolepiota fuliginosa MF-IS2]|uniref:CCHC-type domain-containing protein n=1 Tax=Macrolepiota fuliginosa MF-IS2 TaxID=1400762 RepID=A0A9P5WYD9_9AGAR|nr:hypothetical protein P691DRAFT_769349 [Macrolepiota fuliginosa MF-IS2]